MSRFALFFLLLPIVDFYLLIQIGRQVGFWPTISLVVGTGIVGMSLLRGHGLGRLMATRTQLETGAIDPQVVFSAIAYFLAGVLLMAPGPITDFLGLAVLFPPTRRLLTARFRRWADRQMRSGRMQMGASGPIGMWTFSTSSGFGGQPGGTRYGGTVEAEPVEEEVGEVGNDRRRLDPAKEIRPPRKD
jgi:UPF0716 protein FxsA